MGVVTFAAAVERLAARLRREREASDEARDLAARVGLTVALLRSAERRGLLPPALFGLDAPATASQALARARGDLPALDLAPADVTLAGTEIAAVAQSLDPRDIAAVAARPELIGRLYEQLLARRPDHRKGSGSFFTHPRLADPTVRRTLLPLGTPHRGSPRVLDPAMGTGSLLLPAHRALAAAAVAAGATPREAALAAAGCLHGVDRDPLAVDLCRAALWLEVGDARLDPAALHLRHGDSLLGAWPGQRLSPPGLVIRADGRARGAARRAEGLGLPPRSREEPRDPVALDAWAASWVPCCGAPFLHWERAFPDAGAFDAVIGNPPWEALKPSSRSFFARWDPALPRLGRQAALERRRALLDVHPEADAEWAALQARQTVLGRWVRHVAALRPPGAPFRLQGAGDLNAWKLFAELSMALVRPGGRIGLLLPAAIYTDRGAADLRSALLRSFRWEWLFAFENRARAFPIDNRYKYCVVVAERGGPTDTIRAAFMRRDPSDWDRAEDVAEVVPAATFGGGAVAEVDPTDRLLQRLGPPAGDRIAGDGTGPWALRWATELHTTAHAALFPPRPEWEARGYRATPLGLWLRGPWGASAGAIPSLDGPTLAPEAVEGVAVPLWEGRMIGPLDPAAKAWVEGRGRAARWAEVPWEQKRLGPQYLVDRDVLSLPRVLPGPKVAYARVTSATNARTLAATLLPFGAAADSVFLLRPSGGLLPSLALTGVLGSFVFDAQLRRRLGGLNLSRFVMVEATLPPPDALPPGFPLLVARLCMAHPLFSREWRQLRPTLGDRPPASLWARSRADRLRFGAQLDAVVAAAWGLCARDLAELLSDCACPEGAPATTWAALPPRGHWRVDRALPPQLRSTVLAVAALSALERTDLDRFLASHAHDGWAIPEALDLARLGFPTESGLRQLTPLPPSPPAPEDTTDRDAAWLDALLPPGV
ncbi:MAG: hypothetical protein AMXMBFR64_03570 [Myxococcales bacterium]